MSRELFGTDGVRAIAGEYPLNDAGAVAIGRAIGTQFANPTDEIVISCDTRESSEHLVQMLSQGLRNVGANVVFAGVLPTPGLAYLTAKHDEFVAGVMITASHNPYEYNGVKVFSAAGGKLPDDAEERLNRDIELGVPDRDTGSYQTAPLAAEYEEFLGRFGDDLDLRGTKVVIDTANGSASGFGQRVLERLGAEVIGIGNAPDGRNINVDCGATNTLLLRDTVLRHGADLGIAVDGDADRLIMVDAEGRECNGDHLLYLLAVGMELNHVVATVMTNLGAEQSMSVHGITLDRTAVGDRYVLERLTETAYRLGGEQSGHIILTDFTTTGDGLLAAIQVIRVLTESGKSLSAWRDEVSLLPQALVNFKIADKSKLSLDVVNEYIQAETTKLGKSGRILVRASGTEPLARVMVEAPDAEGIANNIVKHLQELLR